jgi:hypothetical protein
MSSSGTIEFQYYSTGESSVVSAHSSIHTFVYEVSCTNDYDNGLGGIQSTSLLSNNGASTGNS